MHLRAAWILAAAAALVVSTAGAATAASATVPPGPPVVLHSGQVTRQDVGARGGCENDTVVEPDVAVSPVDPDIAIAAAHDCRFVDGGAVDISAAWTADGGASWHHYAVRGVTKATGGAFDRASDPVVAFGPDGTAYLSILAIDVNPCPNSPSAVLVLTSHNGGRTWSKPVAAHYSATCKVSDDKNWLVVDNSPASPHYGRVFQFWTPFLSKDDAATQLVGSPQVVRWSDDEGRTWSKTHFILPANHNSQNSQPMITSDGTIVDTYYDYGTGQRVPDAPPAHPHSAAAVDQNPAVVFNYGPIYASESSDGGATWHSIAEVDANAGGYAQGVRCCLFAADIDPVTGYLYVAFEGGGVANNSDPVFLSVSRDGGFTWSNATQVSRGDVDGIQRVNVDVVARGGSVYVAYGTRTDPSEHGGFVQQQLSVSRDRGVSFADPMSIGPRSSLQYAAQAGGYFPGDYIGEAIAPGRLYGVWAVSSPPPPTSTSRYHQVIWGATLRPSS